MTIHLPPILVEALDDPEVTYGAFHLLAFLIREGGLGGRGCLLTNGQLCMQLRRTENGIRLFLKSLEAHGYISKVQTRESTPSGRVLPLRSIRVHLARGPASLLLRPEGGEG